MADSAKNKTSKVFVWIILVLLILGLAGFGANSLGGNISRIGSVGDTEITVDEYFNALRQEMQREQQRTGQIVTGPEIAARGLDVRARTALVRSAALTEEARVMGLSVGDGEVARQLRQVPAFMGADGQFDRDAYQFALQQNRTSPSQFEDSLRANAAGQLLQQAIAGGVTTSETFSKTLYNYIGETRSFRWAPLEPSLLVGENPSPNDGDLSQFHADQSTLFERPEIRKITYAWLTPEMLLGSLDVPEEDLRELYTARDAQYNLPERRLLERLAFADLEQALAAKAQIDAGETTFDALVEDRGLSLDDVDQGEVARADLDTEIADAVFASDEPGLVGPVETSFGPALFRINAVLQASSTPFEDVRDALLRETELDRATRIVSNEVDPVDDLLVGGATLEELADETQMQLGQIDFSIESEDDIAAYDSFRAAALSATTDDFVEVATLSDGGIFALRLDALVPPALPPLAEIRDEVEAAWQTHKTTERLIELGDTLRAQLIAGTSMEALGLTPTTQDDQTRNSLVEGAPDVLISEVFSLEENSVALIEDDASVTLVELTAITPPDFEDERADAILGQFDQQTSQSLAADLFDLYSQAVQRRHEVSIDLNAVNLVQQQVTGGGYGHNNP